VSPSDASLESQIEEARNLLSEARRVSVLTGAGVSAESGVPTFRGSEGLWKSYRAEELATPEAFDRDPAVVWEWYRWRRGIVGEAKPNAAHETLARWQERFELHLITQNVDGLHTAAGSRDVIELHGCIWRERCLGCGAEGERRETELPEIPPRCEGCGGMLRPAVVWFGEALPQEALQDAMRWAHDCELFLTIGTSAVVQPAASLPLLAAQAGACVIEVNPEETMATPHFHLSLRGKAAEILPRIDPT
jgi:NAD-dependent deacetylase